VVFGAEGPLGEAIIRRLVAEGTPVRAVVGVSDQRYAFPAHAEIVHADPRHRRDAVAAAAGATIIYRCITSVLSAWGEVWPLVTDNIIAAARQHHARLVSPGGVYVYGPLGDLPVTEDHPLDAQGEKGRMRIHTQGALFEAHRSGQVQVVIPRFPDIFGPGVTDRLFADIFHGALHGHRAHWFGALNAPRDFLFVEDAAAAAVRLGRILDAYGRVWHIPGPGAVTPAEFIGMVFTAAGKRGHIGHVTPATLKVESVFDPGVKAFLEFQYLFEGPVVLDGSRFAALCPEFRYTSHEVAVSRTVEWFREHYIS
jgi:nucleoside-diphosphate-sugar epimerase